MPILDLQKRSRELGRIRTGDKAANGAPKKLSKFRITSQSKALLENVAALYGGEVREWTPAGGTQQWEVYTHVDRIPIYVPPQPVTQWYETWSAGGCTHRCDGETDYITGEACDPESKAHTDSKPTTRLNVVLKEVEGIGFFRLESHGWNAAVELPQAAEFLAFARGYVDGWVALEERVSKSIKDGKASTKKYLVPIIEIGVTPAQLMAGEGRVTTPTLEGPVPATAALPAGPTSAPAAAEVPNYLVHAQEASTFQTVVAIRSKAEKAGHLTPELDAQLRVVADSLRNAGAPVPDADGAIDADVVDPEGAAAAADMAWQKVLTVAGKAGLTLEETKGEYAAWAKGESADDASADDLDKFREYLADGHDVQVPA